MVVKEEIVTVAADTARILSVMERVGLIPPQTDVLDEDVEIAPITKEDVLDFLSTFLDIAKIGGEATEVLIPAVARVVVAAETSLLQKAAEKARRDFAEKALLTDLAIVSYLGKTTDGQRANINLSAGVIEAFVEDDGTTIVVKNPIHLLNGLSSDAKLILPELPIDKELKEVGVPSGLLADSLILTIDDFYKTFGGLPSPESMKTINEKMHDQRAFGEAIMKNLWKMEDVIIDMLNGTFESKETMNEIMRVRDRINEKAAA